MSVADARGGAAAPAEADGPLDVRVSRRWFLERMAWVSSAAAAGTLLAPGAAVASPRGRSVTPAAFAAEVRPGALNDLTELSLSESMALVRSGRLSAAELVNAHVDRMERFDGVYQAYADRPSRAELLEAVRRSPAGAPLAGMTLAAKDNFYTRDLRTEGGSLVFRGFRPEYDATAVALVRASGGVVVGKAQMGNLAGGRAAVPGTETPTTRNAWTPGDVRYSPAGSSSGSATAVAARLAVVAIGTQTGGSVIGPGVAQGLTCLKPTFGRVSLHGVIPLSHTRDHVGVMARDAKDAAILLQLLAQPDPLDPRTLGLPEPPDYALAATPLPGAPAGVRWPTRVGVWPGYLASEDARVNELRRQTLAELERSGARIVPQVTLPEQWDLLTGEPFGESHGDPTAFFLEHLRKDVRLFAGRLPRFLNGMLQSADTYVKVQQARGILLHRVLTQLFDQCDVVLTPASGGAFDSIGLPMLCMPIGFGTDPETGLRVPRGAVLAARPFGEERLLAVAAAYQAATDYHRARPADPEA